MQKNFFWICKTMKTFKIRICCFVRLLHISSKEIKFESFVYFSFFISFSLQSSKTQFSRLSISEADFAIEKNKRWRDNHNSAKKISEAFDHNGNENDGTMRMQIFGSTLIKKEVHANDWLEVKLKVKVKPSKLKL